MNIILNAAFNVFANVGITKYLQRLTKSLQHKCELTVLTPESAVFPEDVHTIKIPVWTARSYGRILWVITGLRRHITFRPNTVLLCPTPDTPPWPALPTISVVHDLTPLILPACLRFADKLFFLASIHTLRWADTILTDSGNTAQDLVRRFPGLAGRVSVCYNGPGITPTSRTTGFARELRPYLLYVGGYAMHKNLTRMVKAFAALKERPDLRLVLVGGAHDSNMDTVLLTARKLKIDDRVSFLRNLTDDSVSELYKSAELFMYPSLYEGFGLPVLEALIHGTPVVCSRAASIPEVAGSLAIYFNPADTGEIAAATRYALSHRATLAARVSSARHQLARFSWDAAADKILLSAEELLHSKKP